MGNPETFTKFGKFLISGNELWGELHVAGKDSMLYLRDDKEFNPNVSAEGCVTGVLHDLTKVTLLKCLNLTGVGYGSKNDETYYYAKIFPHFVLACSDFWEIIIGRPQNLQTLFVQVEGHDRERLKVHWSHRPAREEESGEGRRSPHPADVLLMPVEDPEEFCRVMQFWLKNDEERQDARVRFHSSFAMQRTYSVERLVASANMFDILPKSAVPQDVDLTADVLQAKAASQKLFRKLPVSYERDSVLNALGRVGKASLKHKTRSRGELVVKGFGGRPSELFLVLDAAVDCRNHYVHGAPSRIDYNKNFDVVIFFTNTLEFVFAAAELIEAGWEIQRYAERGSTGTHPFGSYLVSYKSNLKALKILLNA